MPALALDDLRPQAFLATEADERGSTVRDIAAINLDRVIWIEADTEARELRFQIDRDGWLRVVLGAADDFETARARLRSALRTET